MNQNSNTLPRRSFLTGIASVVGATALSPTIATARGRATDADASSVGHQLHFWDGQRFVTDNSHLQPVGEAVRVQIERIGHFASYSAIDVQLPGGLFHAFSGHENGVSKARFSTHVAPLAPLALLVRSGETTTRFDLPLSLTGGLALRHGTYLLTEDSQAVGDLHLHRDTATPVTNAQGHPTHLPYTLIDISPA
jgi:hypothetical protein